MKNKYVLVGANFLPNEFPETENKIKEALEFLETMINSEMFKEFIINGKYTNTRGLDNIAVYDLFRSKDIILDIKITDNSPLNRGFNVNPNTNVITARHNIIKNYDIPRIAAILAHGYGHILGFNHRKTWASSFLYFLEFKGELFFEEFYFQLKQKGFPNPGSWLVHRPLWGFIWFYKVLKWS